jgi:isopentenyl diphosphate isomerase/L-lactate dehydrogenase-like FMN-dependent dehydrogenase
VPFVTSSCGSFSLEQIADALGSTPRWFQLYWVTDREVTASFVKRAEAAGYEAIAVTVDTLTLGYRDRDIRNDNYLPFLFGDGIGQFTSDPVFRSRLPEEGADDPATQGLTMVSMFPNLALNWDDFEWLREQTSLPILIKGILTAEDARKAMEIGIDGIMVSNHGGRQVDGAISALDALVEVRDAVGPGPVVMMDSGIRRAPDMLKALALGADAVLLGRPYVYALATAGQAGVEQLLRSTITELESTFALLGCSRVSDLDRSYVRRI